MTDMKVLEFRQNTDVRETLQYSLSQADELDGVIVLKLYKDGSPGIDGSTMSGYQKAYLVSFLQSWFFTTWFHKES